MSASNRTYPARQCKRSNYRLQRCSILLCVRKTVHSCTNMTNINIKIKEKLTMRLKDLEEEAYGPEDYEKIKAKQKRERKDEQKKSDRVKREREQVAKAQNELRTQRQQAQRASSS